jgi:hypothetical protein
MVEVVERESGISGEVVKWMCNLALERASLKQRDGMSCPEKDRCTNYSCAGGFLRVFREWISGFYDQLKTRPSSLFMLFG